MVSCTSYLFGMLNYKTGSFFTCGSHINRSPVSVSYTHTSMYIESETSSPSSMAISINEFDLLSNVTSPGLVAVTQRN